MQAKVLSYLAKLKEKQIRSPTIVTHICIIYLASLQAEAGPAEDFEVTCQSWGGAPIGVGVDLRIQTKLGFAIDG